MQAMTQLKEVSTQTNKHASSHTDTTKHHTVAKYVQCTYLSEPWAASSCHPLSHPNAHCTCCTCTAYHPEHQP